MTEYKELAARLRAEVEYDNDKQDGPGEITYGRVFAEAASAIEALEAELADFRAATATPEAIHANMLRGGFPILSIRQALHLHGEDALKRWDSIEALEAERDEAARSFWLELREPGCVPERKGPWPHHMTAMILREFMRERPQALISVLSWHRDHGPLITDGPETLQMLDGRSMSTGRKHIKSSGAAHAAEARCKRLEEALREISSPTQTEKLLWWQERARLALGGSDG